MATGALAIGGTSVFGSNNASAVELEIGEFQVEDTTSHSAVESVDVTVAVSGTWDADVVPDGLDLQLEAGAEGTDLTELDTIEIDNDLDKNGEIDETLKANILESSSLSQSDFELLTGQSERQVDVGFRLTGQVIKDDATLAETELEETATVIVKDAQAKIELKATGTMET